MPVNLSTLTKAVSTQWNRTPDGRFLGLNKLYEYGGLMKRLSLTLFALIALLTSCYAFAAPQDHGVDYDIVYVRYPAVDSGDNFVTIPQGENPYNIAAGADLMLLHPDGSEEVLVDCTTCSVMDPFISFDGRYVYYSKIEDIPNGGAFGTKAGGFIWKIDLTASAPRPEIQLTFDDGFETNINGQQDMDDYRKLRDMAPFPIAGGKIGFTSNRAGLVPFGTRLEDRSGSLQQIYVMDDHDGSKNTAALSNLHRIDNSNISMAQHPMQLKDGRIIYSTWQDVAVKEKYAMTALFTMNPDGSKVEQFTEPHVQKKFLDHFVTQLPNEDIVWGYYYPSFDYGYGVLLRAPLDSGNVDFVNRTVPNMIEGGRLIERIGTVNLTPFTTPADAPAPELTDPSSGQTVGAGKFSMPSYGKDGHMLTAYSSGYVNHFDAVCGNQNKCDPLMSGVYLILNAETTVVDSPFNTSRMVELKDDPSYNEIWPRAVLPYSVQYGVNTPSIPILVSDGPQDTRLSKGEAAAMLGTSSMLLKDPITSETPFREPSTSRHLLRGNWRVRGAEAGVFDHDEVYAVRIIGTPPKPYAGVLSGSLRSELDQFLRAPTGLRVTRRYGGLHNEKWEILGEFILPHTSNTNSLGNKDTSWLAKVPADVPFLIQTLDRNGMTMVSEHTWRALKAGEKRADCGGCHNHTRPSLDYNTTSSGQNSTIQNVAGLSNNEPRISEGYFDLTNGVPLLTENGMAFTNSGAITVEYSRDIVPVINNRCVACHTTGGSNGGLILDVDAWAALTNKASCPDGTCREPQRSRYIRIPQARESLLVWATWGERLDGRTNGERSDDVDFNGHPTIPGLTDIEKRTIARWVDLGSPVDLSQTDGVGYIDDAQSPVINVDLQRGQSRTGGRFRIGVTDAKSSVNWSSLVIQYSTVISDTPIWQSVNTSGLTANADGVVVVKSIKEPRYLLRISVDDSAGNTAVYESSVETQTLNVQSIDFGG